MSLTAPPACFSCSGNYSGKTVVTFNCLTGLPNSTNCAGRMANRRMFQELKEILTNNVSSPFLPIGFFIRPHDCSFFMKLSTW